MADYEIQVAVVIISMLLCIQNCATNAFQVFMGVFLSNTGMSQQVISILNYMGLSISYFAQEHAQNFVLSSTPVYSLSSRFSRAIYSAALSIANRHHRACLQENLTLNSLCLSLAKQAQLMKMILLMHGNVGLSQKKIQKFKQKIKSCKPQICLLSVEKMETIQVVKKLFTQLLGLAEEMIDTELHLLVQECAMPFHFQLNAMYMLFQTYLGHTGNNDPGSLEHHRTLLYHAKLDLKKPEYNKAKELLYHSLIAHIIDCIWYYISYHFIGLCHNYHNEILEMKAQFEYEFPETLRDIMEHTWLVNRWGIPGHSILTDLYLEHNNRFIKVSATGDIKALLSDVELQWVHEFTSGWRVPPPPT
ncbi:hypothetical protein LXA43DRAFT_977173 [Ganoderma leucocontextum]|nr:hypothetical protein LXA43DRAFT_977173 [Ganoderma leucocontextum]